MTFRTMVFALLLLAVVPVSSISPAQESALDRVCAATPNVCGSQSRSRVAEVSDCQRKRDQCKTRCPRVDEASDRYIRQCESMRC
jgi:hypothetical protein